MGLARQEEKGQYSFLGSLLWRENTVAPGLSANRKLPRGHPVCQLVLNRLSDNVGAVKKFLSTLLLALIEERHFALVEAVAFALPT